MGIEAPLNGTLKTYIVPRTPTTHTLDHEKIRIGQIAHVIARHKGLLAAADVKIKRIERHLKDPGRTRITFGDPLPLQSDFIHGIERMADWRDRRRRKLDRGRGPATVTVASKETSAGYQYARFIIQAGQMVNEVMPEILSLLPDGGGQIVFMEGTYFFDGNIAITRDNVHLKGQGEGTRFVLVGDAEEENFVGIYVNGRTGVEIADLSMDGNRSSLSKEWKDGIHIRDCTDVVISKLSVRNFMGNGIELWGQNNSIQIINNRTISDNYLGGIYAWGDGQTTMRNISIINNVIERNAYNIIMYDVVNSIISENKCSDPDSDYADSPPGFSILTLTGCENNVFANNIVRGATYIGLVASGDRNIVSGNVCYQNETGVGVDGNYNNVQGNKCYENDLGMEVAGNNNLITNNDLGDNVTGGLVVWGTGNKTDPGNRV